MVLLHEELDYREARINAQEEEIKQLKSARRAAESQLRIVTSSARYLSQRLGDLRAELATREKDIYNLQEKHSGRVLSDPHAGDDAIFENASDLSHRDDHTPVSEIEAIQFPVIHSSNPFLRSPSSPKDQAISSTEIPSKYVEAPALTSPNWQRLARLGLRRGSDPGVRPLDSIKTQALAPRRPSLAVEFNLPTIAEKGVTTRIFTKPSQDAIWGDRMSQSKTLPEGVSL